MTAGMPAFRRFIRHLHRLRLQLQIPGRRLHQLMFDIMCYHVDPSSCPTVSEEDLTKMISRRQEQLESNSAMARSPPSTTIGRTRTRTGAWMWTGLAALSSGVLRQMPRPLLHQLPRRLQVRQQRQAHLLLLRLRLLHRFQQQSMILECQSRRRLLMLVLQTLRQSPLPDNGLKISPRSGRR